MIDALIRWSLSNRLAVVILSGLLLGVGGYVVRTVPVDVFPDLTAPTVTILVEGAGMATEEMEKLVTFPIETAVNGAPNVRRVRSATAVGITVVWVEFEWGTDIYKARQTVSERLGAVSDNLPAQVEAPFLAPVTSIMGEILFIALASESHSAVELHTTARTILRRRLLAVPGVAQVSALGGEEKQYQVVLSRQRLRAYRVGVAEVAEALRSANENVSAGFLVQGGQESVIQGVGRIRTTEDITGTKVAVRNDTPIKVSDLGVVMIGPAIQRGMGAASRRGPNGEAVTEPAVIIAIQKQPTANTLALTNKLDAAIDEIAASLPDGMHIDKELFRQATFIETSVANTVEALRDGGIMVILIVVLFLASLRPSIITLLAIPFSLIAAVLVLKAIGATINTMTLGGMAIAIGSLVDDAIIDVENIVRRLRENSTLPEDQRRPVLEIIYKASVEVRASIVFATAIILLVFVPLFFLSGVEGRLLRPLGLAYVVSLAASLVVAVTLTPALSAYLLPGSRTIQAGHEPKVVRLCKWLYVPALDWAMKHAYRVIVPTGILLLGAIGATVFMGRSFLPEFNEGALVVGLVTAPGTSLEESDRLAGIVQDTLMEHPEVVGIGRRTGRAEEDEHVQGVEASELEVTLDMDGPRARGLPRRSKADLLQALREELAAIPGMRGTFGQPISHRIDHMLSGTRANIAVKIFGPDLRKLRQLADQAQRQMASIAGVVDLSVEPQTDIPILRIDFDRRALARFDLKVADVAEAVEAAFRGRIVTQVLEDVNAYDLVVRVGDPKRIKSWVEATPAEAAEVLIDTPDQIKVPLKILARITQERSPNMVMRENGQRRIVVQCNVAGRDLGSVVSNIRSVINRTLDLPQEYYVQYGGQFESAEATRKRLGVLSVLVLIGVGFLLHVALGSGRDAMLVMVNLPLALIGGVVGVFLSDGVLSVASLIGFISVFGIAARNGIMMVSHIRHLQRFENVGDFEEAVRRGAVERLAPILMTALSAGLALLPLALGRGQPGKEILHPMAMVILFGLLSATFLNIFVVPALFVRFAQPAPAGREASGVSWAPGITGAAPTAAALLIGVALPGFSGCAGVEPEFDYVETRRLITESTGLREVHDPSKPVLSEEELDAILSDGISLEEALRLALVNNRQLQAEFLSIGMARADYVQAGLLSNPSLGIALRLPAAGGLANIDFDLAQNIADLWQIPVRQRAAERNVKETILAIARQATDTVARAKAGYYATLGADRRLEIAHENLDVARKVLELTELLQRAGSGSELDVNLARGVMLGAELAVKNARLSAASRRRSLATVLGIAADPAGIELTDSLPAAPSHAFDDALLVETAKSKRLDARAVRQSVQRAEEQVVLEYRRVFQNVSVGLAFERESRPRAGGRDLVADTARASIAGGRLTAPEIQPRSARDTDTEFIIGPLLSLELPVFDQNQAQITKARYVLEQRTRLLEGLERSIEQEVREAADQARTAWGLARFYRDQIIPQAEKNLNMSRDSYNAGRSSILSVLDAERTYLEARDRYAESLQKAAEAVPDLERTVGLPLPVLLARINQNPPTTAPATQPTGPTSEGDDP